MRVKEGEQHLKDSDLTHLIKRLLAGFLKDPHDDEQGLVLQLFKHLGHLLKHVDCNRVCFGDLLLHKKA